MSQKIAYLTDLHLDEQYPKEAGANTFLHWERALEKVATLEVDRVILGGDLGEATALPYLFKSLQDYPDLHLTLGNHDELADYKDLYPKAAQAATTLYYSFDEAPYRFIFLDSSAGIVSSEQVEWLQDQLSTNLQVLLFIHHPIFGIEALVDELFPLRGREVLQDLLLSSGATITIFCGHYHTPHEQTIDTITQLITPAVSVQFDTQAPQLRFHADSFGFRLIELSNEGVSSEVVWV